LRRAVVAHHHWNQAGGGELVMARASRSLMERGYEVYLVSIFQIDFSRIKDVFNIDLSGAKTYSLKIKEPRFFGIYQRILFPFVLSRALRKIKPQIILLDLETYKPILKHKNELKFKIVEYIHFPFSIFLHKDVVEVEQSVGALKYLSEAREYHIKYSRGLWKPYFSLYLKFYKMVARENPFEAADAVMANSKYVARLVKLLWGEEPTVVYPPVRVSDFEGLGAKGFEERDDAVVVIGRITPEKRIEDVVRAIAGSETKPVLRVVGGLLPASIPYMERVGKLAERLGVRAEFYPNIPRRKLVEIATSSKVLVHATVGEHFGIAVVEGMAAGCPVVVRRESGTYEDILNNGEYGLGYTSIEELSEAIDKLLTDRRLWTRYHELSLKRSGDFSEERFDRQISSVVEGLL
jgi:alpha-1,2-mannosyltransferase